LLKEKEDYASDIYLKICVTSTMFEHFGCFLFLFNRYGAT